MNEGTSEGDRRLEAWLADAPRVAPSAAFRAQVMGALARRRAGPVRHFLFSPRILKWNFAGLAGAFAVALLAVGIAWTLQPSVDPGPDAARVVKVRFVLDRPGASAVSLAGDFTGWKTRVALERQADGTWQAELRLAPGEYEYAFVVDDDQWIQDPSATRFRNDGFGGRNAVLLVPGVNGDRNAG
ncbi:MAG TPA: glycogen-binding domain-containing protein [Burkholderiales bacterium]|nr:glycogen-binding domain-containing protein [Burkholderiales bacterium]